MHLSLQMFVPQSVPQSVHAFSAINTFQGRIQEFKKGVLLKEYVQSVPKNLE